MKLKRAAPRDIDEAVYNDILHDIIEKEQLN